MTLLDQATTAQNPEFVSRVRMAMVTAAVQISSEAADPGDPVSARRHSLAFTVLSDPAGYEARFTWACLTNAAVATAGTAAPDADLQFVVASVWDALAGTSLTAF